MPDDISVVGFDDVPDAGFYTPALTTVRFDFAGLGRRAFDLLMNAPDSAPLEKPTLVVRESTGPAPTTIDKDDR